MEHPRGVVLVEGASDRLALEALAERRGLDLRAEAVAIVAMGGVTNLGHFLDRFGPRGQNARLAGLYDAGQHGYVRRSLERAGLGADLTPAEVEALGFHMCVADLEDELIRALGIPAVERIVKAQGELRSLRTFQRQAAQRERGAAEQFRRFMGTRARRKARYATLLVRALDLARVPRPLDRALDHI